MTSRRSSTSPATAATSTPSCTLLDCVLEFTDRTARAAMIPRPRVTSVAADDTVEHLVEVMSGHFRLPMLGDGGAMRERRHHLALVESGGELLGLVTLQDLLDRLLPAPA